MTTERVSQSAALLTDRFADRFLWIRLAMSQSESVTKAKMSRKIPLVL